MRAEECLLFFTASLDPQLLCSHIRQEISLLMDCERAEKVEIWISSVLSRPLGVFQVLGHKWRFSLLVDNQRPHCSFHRGEIKHEWHGWMSLAHTQFFKIQISLFSRPTRWTSFSSWTLSGFWCRNWTLAWSSSTIQLSTGTENKTTLQTHQQGYQKWDRNCMCPHVWRWVGAFNSLSMGAEQHISVGDCGNDSVAQVERALW